MPLKDRLVIKQKAGYHPGEPLTGDDRGTGGLPAEKWEARPRSR